MLFLVNQFDFKVGIVELRLYIVLDISGSLSMNLVVSWWMDL